MSTDPLSFLALTAYMVYVAALVTLSSRLASTFQILPNAREHSVSNRCLGQSLAVAPAFAAFLILPPGGLPPFFSFSTSMLALFMLFGLTLILLGSSTPAARQRSVNAALYGLLPLAMFCGAFAFFAYSRGFPGSPFGMEIFNAIPLWSVASIPGKIWISVSFLGLLLCMGRAFPLAGNHPLAMYALRLAVAHTILVLLLPPLFIRLAPKLDLILIALFELGLRWLLAFLLAHKLMPLATRVQNAALGPLLLGLGLAGMTAIFIY